MSSTNAVEQAVSLLQQLGLKEYEAKCFVGLSRLSTGTAKELSEITDVPRTRVYDAIRVLESQGLVEVQHSSPQQFRAVSIQEATETLRDQYESRVDRLSQALDQTDIIEDDRTNGVQEVWAMSGPTAIANRAQRLIEAAAEEVVLVLGDKQLLTEDLYQTLNDLADDVDLLVGAVTKPLEKAINEAVPSAETFVSGLEWLRSDAVIDDGLEVGRLLLVDRSTILVSSLEPDSGEEHAIYGSGFGNGLVVIARRILAQGLIPARDPEQV